MLVRTGDKQQLENGWLQEHNASLINFVLSEVEREVREKYENWVHAEEFHGFNADRLKKDYNDISTIINNLRVK